MMIGSKVAAEHKSYEEAAKSIDETLEIVISDADMEVLKQVKKIENYGDASMFPVYGGKL